VRTQLTGRYGDIGDHAHDIVFGELHEIPVALFHQDQRLVDGGGEAHEVAAQTGGDDTAIIFAGVGMLHRREGFLGIGFDQIEQPVDVPQHPPDIAVPPDAQHPDIQVALRRLRQHDQRLVDAARRAGQEMQGQTRQTCGDDGQRAADP
jgi:hypothetical protein